jgi:hypothetical protein
MKLTNAGLEGTIRLLGAWARMRQTIQEADAVIVLLK